MIELQGIYGYNFVTYQEFSLDLTKIQDNLIFIQGENKDIPALGGNGVGKSLIPDMVSWCLYGKTVRGMRADEVIGNFDKVTNVALNFEDSGIPLIVARSRTKDKGIVSFLINGVKQGEQDEIDKYFMDWSVFRNAVLMGQDDVERFTNMTDKNKKAIISSMLGLEIFTLVRPFIKKKLDRLNTNLVSTRTIINSANDTISALEAQEKLVQKEADDRAARLQKQLETLQSEIYDYKKSLELLKLDLKMIPRIEKKLIRLHQVWKDWSFWADLNRNKLLDKINKFDTKIREIEDRCNFRKKNLEIITQNILGADSLIGTICMSCGITVKKVNIPIFIKTQKERATIHHKEIIKETKELRKLVEERATDSDIYSGLVNKRNNIRETYDSERNLLESEVAVLKDRRKTYRTIAKTIASAKMKERAMKDEVDQAYRAVFKIKELIKHQKRVRTDHDKNKIRIENEISILDDLYDAFGPRGIQAYAMDEVADTMTSVTEEVLDQVVDGDIQVKFVTGKQRRKKVTSEFDILVTDVNKPTPLRFVLWSGGEKSRISFAIIMAFMRHIQNKLNMFWIDEALDRNISEVGIDRIVDYLQTLPNRIFVISHKNQMRSKFNTVLEVVLENGESKATLLN